MDNERIKELLFNAVEYLAELKERDNTEDWNIFWQDIMGMTEEEMTEYSLLREEED